MDFVDTLNTLIFSRKIQIKVKILKVTQNRLKMYIIVLNTFYKNILILFRHIYF